MKPVFADTFYYLALINPADTAHAGVLAFSRDSRVRLVTTAWVIMEIGDGLAPRPTRRLLRPLVETIRSDARTRFVGFSARTLDEALTLYNSRPDKRWSLTDCTSFVVMKRLGLREALTGDAHFRQAGFTMLPV